MGTLAKLEARRKIAVLLACALVALIGSGCGGSDNDSSSVEGKPRAPTAEAPVQEEQPEGVFVSSGIPGKDRVVVNAVGMTLYHFEKDKRNSGKTACYGECTKVWDPYLTVGEPQAELYARQDLLGTIKRKDGPTQVTYAGLPVYLYASDGAAKLTGAGKKSFGAYWYPIKMNGEDAR